MEHVNIRQDYPRPQFERSSWINLNGEWDFAFGDQGIASGEEISQDSFTHKINVPFAYQAALSGIGETEFHNIVWYRRTFAFTEQMENKRTILHFGAVDYRAWVWVNGKWVGYHEGGHTPFSLEITEMLSRESNTILVKVEDFNEDMTLPRGKQYWKPQSEHIFYTATTGIWQSVWLETVSSTYLNHVKYTPDIDQDEIHIAFHVYGLDGSKEISVEVLISFEGRKVSRDMFFIHSREEARSIKLRNINSTEEGILWSPESPNLYDVEYVVYVDGQEVDRVSSYFGMRKISIENGQILLNNRPYYMKMVLDQGYFPGGLLTAPSDDMLRKDVELTKSMGFNGARKHQKIEDPRYLYWCDRLGLLVWGEMASSFQYSNTYVRRMTQEWQEAIERDYNHPCIVAWVPLNESWGFRNINVDAKQKAHSLMMYHLTKSLDSTRLAMSNDGWEHTCSDICTIHDYEYDEQVLRDRYADTKVTGQAPATRTVYATSFAYHNEPIIVSEFGGIAFRTHDQEGWGYSGADSEEDFLQRMTAVIRPLLQSPVVQGYCYTQFTDVEQEVNGLLTYDRQPKVPIEMIKAINEARFS